MKRITLGAALALAVPPASALYPTGEPEWFRWTEPTAYVDGTPLDPATEIQAYVLKCNRASPVLAVELVIGSGGQTQWDVAEGTFAEGEWTCNLYAEAISSLRSGPSAAVRFQVATYKFNVAPAAPMGLQVG